MLTICFQLKGGILVLILFRVEEYIHEQFDGTGVEIEVIKGQSMLEDMYPCLAVVNRCASSVPRQGDLANL